MVVVLPAPFGPSRPTISLRRTTNEMPSTATVSPYCLRRLATVSTSDSLTGLLTCRPFQMPVHDRAGYEHGDREECLHYDLVYMAGVQ